MSTVGVAQPVPARDCLARPPTAENRSKDLAISVAATASRPALPPRTGPVDRMLRHRAPSGAPYRPLRPPHQGHREPGDP